MEVDQGLPSGATRKYPLTLGFTDVRIYKHLYAMGMNVRKLPNSKVRNEILMQLDTLINLTKFKDYKNKK